MGRRGNPYDNAKAESFMKTLKVEAVYPMAFETFEDVAADLFVHPQTVRYRMNQLRELYGDALEDPQTVLMLTLALA